MAEYIEREAALSAVDCGNLHKGIVDALQENIKDIPAADVVEARHGQWIFDFALDGSNFYRCSECGRQECLLAKYSIYEFAPYCHCGAKMAEV